jgi:hypothetical protein
MISEHELIEDPDVKFSTIWKNWYDYLGIDVSIYPSDKHIWLQKCNKLKIHSLKTYYEYTKTHDDMPKMPTELYNINNIMTIFKQNFMML